jgi:hypothetical protein
MFYGAGLLSFLLSYEFGGLVLREKTCRGEAVGTGNFSGGDTKES